MNNPESFRQSTFRVHNWTHILVSLLLWPHQFWISVNEWNEEFEFYEQIHPSFLSKSHTYFSQKSSNLRFPLITTIHEIIMSSALCWGQRTTTAYNEATPWFDPKPTDKVNERLNFFCPWETCKAEIINGVLYLINYIDEQYWVEFTPFLIRTGLQSFRGEFYGSIEMLFSDAKEQ